MTTYSNNQIGGRDASILSTMQHENVQIIATDDKNILSIKEFTRIDPVFSPPLILNKGEIFDYEMFKRKRKSLKM